MITFVQRRIGRRIGAIIGATMAAFGLGGLILVLTETSRKQEETETRLARTLAETISASFQSFDARLGQHPIDDIAVKLAEREEIEELDVFDDRGRIRWSADPRRKGTNIDPALLRSVLTSSSAGAEAQARVLTAKREIVLPLRKTSSCLPCHAKSADPIGGVHIVSSHQRLLGSSEAFPRQAAASVFLFSILIALFLFFLINRVVVARLGNLVEVMAKAEEGDFLVRAEVSSNDEIGLLASTFNKMLAKITDLRVEHIDKEREMHEVLDELQLKAEITKRGDLLEAANRRLNARLNQISFLYNLGRDLASELELDALLERFGELVEKSLGVPEFAVLLLDRNKQQLSVVKARGLSKEDLAERSFDVGQGATGEALRTRQPIYVPNLSTKNTNGSALVVPVIYQENLIGLLIFSSPVVDAFGEEERELFAAIANHAALALANAQLFQKTLQLSNTDGLTGILNRRAMEARLDLEWSRALRDKASLALLMIDIDHFKFYNDQHGHQLGDETLRRVARLLERNIRKVDAVARYGGEEFVVILPRASKTEAIEVANKLRRSVEQSDFVQGYMQPLGRVTISCGVAAAPDDADSIADLITCADDALFRAKQGGRNQAVAYSRTRAPSISREFALERSPAPSDRTTAPDDTDWNDDSNFS